LVPFEKQEGGSVEKVATASREEPFAVFDDWDREIDRKAYAQPLTMSRFTTLVVVEDPDHTGLLRRVRSVREAAEVLLGHWPKQGRGPMFLEALRACHEALAGKLTTEEARQAFIEAALEAGIFVREVPLRGC
jgi:uncharacterized protein DUF982